MREGGEGGRGRGKKRMRLIPTDTGGKRTEVSVKLEKCDYSYRQT